MVSSAWPGRRRSLSSSGQPFHALSANLRQASPLRDRGPFEIRNSSGFMGPRGSCWLIGSGTCLRRGSQFYISYDFIDSGRWRSGWAQIEHLSRNSTWLHEFLDLFQQVLHGAGALYQNLKSMTSGRRIR